MSFAVWSIDDVDATSCWLGCFLLQFCGFNAWLAMQSSRESVAGFCKPTGRNLTLSNDEVSISDNETLSIQSTLNDTCWHPLRCARCPTKERTLSSEASLLLVLYLYYHKFVSEKWFGITFDFPNTTIPAEPEIRSKRCIIFAEESGKRVPYAAVGVVHCLRGQTTKLRKIGETGKRRRRRTRIPLLICDRSKVDQKYLI